MNSLLALLSLAFAVASASVIHHAVPFAAAPVEGGAVLKGPSFSSLSVGPDGSSISSVEDSGAVEVGARSAVGYAAIPPPPPAPVAWAAPALLPPPPAPVAYAAPAAYPPPPAPVAWAAPAVLPPPPAPVAYAAPAVLPPPPPVSVAYSSSTVYHPPPAPVAVATRAYIPPPPAPVAVATRAYIPPPPPAPISYAAPAVLPPPPAPVAYAGPVPTGTLIDGPSGRIETSGSAVGVIAKTGYAPWSSSPVVEARSGW